MSWIVEVKDPFTGDWIHKEFDNKHKQAAIDYMLNYGKKGHEIYHS